MPGGTQTANGQMVEYITQWNNAWSPVVHFDGNFDGASITVSFKNESGGFSDITDGGVYTAAADDVINFQRKTTMRLTLSSAGASTSVNWNLV